MKTEIKFSFNLVVAKRPQNIVDQEINRFVSLSHEIIR